MKQLQRLGMIGVLGLMLGSGVAVMQAQGGPSASSVYPAYQLAIIRSINTVQLLTGTGVLHTVCINTKGSSSNTLTLWDSTASSGAGIAVIDTTAAVGCLLYDVAFTTGLRAVVAAGGAADVTLSYRQLR